MVPGVGEARKGASIVRRSLTKDADEITDAINSVRHAGKGSRSIDDVVESERVLARREFFDNPLAKIKKDAEEYYHYMKRKLAAGERDAYGNKIQP